MVIPRELTCTLYKLLFHDEGARVGIVHIRNKLLFHRRDAWLSATCERCRSRDRLRRGRLAPVRANPGHWFPMKRPRILGRVCGPPDTAATESGLHLQGRMGSAA